MSLNAKLAAAKLPERTVEICLRGDLQADFEDLERQLSAIVDQPSSRIVGNAEAKKLVKQIEQLRAEMSGSMQVFRLRAFPRGRYAALMADHPAMPGDERSTNLGYNPDTFFEDALRRSVIDPADIDDATWTTLLDSITDQQYSELIATVQVLNTRPVSVPFSRAALRMTPASAPGSKPQGG